MTRYKVHGNADAKRISVGEKPYIEHIVRTQHPYPILIGAGLLSSLAQALPSSLAGCKIAVVADDTVAALYGSLVQTSLAQAGYEHSLFTFPPGEASKTLATYSQILEFLAGQGLDRGDAILALGGGVTGDLAGFAAATYVRGIRFVQMPTTLLAAVDSSVGGKTAVNLSKGKNLAGAFWQPAAVLCDTEALGTLPEMYYVEGIAEAIKYGVLGDAALFDLLRQPIERGLESETEMIRRCVAFKTGIVEEDEKERGVRALLNFGHTVAHAIERNSGYVIRHGQAVALGMIAVTRAAQRQGFAEAGTLEALVSVLHVHGLDRITLEEQSLQAAAEAPDVPAGQDGPLHPDALLQAIGTDKKRRGDYITLVLPRRIGHCELVSMPLAEATAFLRKGFV